MPAPIRKRRFPLIGDGGGVWSFIHIEDAAAATAAAVEHGPPGVYNIVDDEPAPVREWLPVLASALGAKPPRRIPRWLGRLVAGEGATIMMTDARGASNAKAKRELGWSSGIRAGGWVSPRGWLTRCRGWCEWERTTAPELPISRPCVFASDPIGSGRPQRANMYSEAAGAENCASF